MTKPELQSAFNITELVGTPAFHGVISYLAENFPKALRGTPRDGTTIVNDEGRVQGWLECVTELREIGKISRPVEKTEIQPYSEPAARSPQPKK